MTTALGVSYCERTSSPNPTSIIAKFTPPRPPKWMRDWPPKRPRWKRRPRPTPRPRQGLPQRKSPRRRPFDLRGGSAHIAGVSEQVGALAKDLCPVHSRTYGDTDDFSSQDAGVGGWNLEASLTAARGASGRLARCLSASERLGRPVFVGPA